MNYVELVEEFHKKFQCPVGETPSLITNERAKLRHCLMSEEVGEYLEGCEKEDLPNVVKEIVDVLYSAFGTVVEHGLQDVIEEAFKEVHRSNMSKDYNELKMTKGKDYKPADIESILNSKSL